MTRMLPLTVDSSIAERGSGRCITTRMLPLTELASTSPPASITTSPLVEAARTGATTPRTPRPPPPAVAGGGGGGEPRLARQRQPVGHRAVDAGAGEPALDAALRAGRARADRQLAAGLLDVHLEVAQIGAGAPVGSRVRRLHRHQPHVR